MSSGRAMVIALLRMLPGCALVLARGGRVAGAGAGVTGEAHLRGTAATEGSRQNTVTLGSRVKTQLEPRPEDLVAPWPHCRHSALRR